MTNEPLLIIVVINLLNITIIPSNKHFHDYIIGHRCNEDAYIGHKKDEQ